MMLGLFVTMLEELEAGGYKVTIGFEWPRYMLGCFQKFAGCVGCYQWNATLMVADMVFRV